MDKQSFVGYIKSLSMNPGLEKTILNHIESHEFGDQMVEDVANILETAADEADMAAEELDKVINEMEGLKEDLQEGIGRYEDMTDEDDAKYQSDVASMLDEEITSLGQQPTEQAPAIPVEEQPVVSPETVQPEMTEVQSQETPAIQTESATVTPPPVEEAAGTSTEAPAMPEMPMTETTTPMTGGVDETPQETPVETPPPAPTL